MIRRSRITAAVLAGVVVSALSGCNSPGSAATVGSRPSAAVDETTVRFIVEHRGALSEHRPQLVRATEELVQRCMRGKGLRYYKGAFEPEPDADVAVATLMGTLDMTEEFARRRRSGFGLHEAAVKARRGRAPRNDAYVLSLPEEEQARYGVALFGDPKAVGQMRLPDGQVVSYSTSGCLARAEGRVYGSPKMATRLLYFPQAVFGQVMRRIERDKRLAVANSRWSECMRKARAGRWPNPGALRDAVDQSLMASGPTRQGRLKEIRLAVKDLRCASKAGLLDFFSKALRAQINSLPGATLDVIAALLVEERKAAQRAKRLNRTA